MARRAPKCYALYRISLVILSLLLTTSHKYTHTIPWTYISGGIFSFTSCADTLKVQRCTVYLRFWAQSHQWFSFPQNSNSMENWLNNTIPSHQITSNFCTQHDSRAVVSCAKFCSDQYVRIWMKVIWFFHWNRSIISLNLNHDGKIVGPRSGRIDMRIIKWI